MRFLILAQKDLLQLLREKRALLFIVLMPIAFTTFMGIAYHSGSQTSDHRLVLGWQSPDHPGLADKTLHEFLSQSDVVRLEDFPAGQSQTDLVNQVRRGNLAGVLLVPSNYTKQVLNAKSIPLTLVTEEYSTNGQDVIQAVRIATSRLMSSVEIADLVLDTLGSSSDDLHTTVFQEASAAWKKTSQNGLSYHEEMVRGVPSVTLALSTNPFKQSSPGTLVQFAIFGLVTSAGILVEERKNGTLQRLMTSSLSRAEIIAGHILAMFSVVILQSTLLVLFGQIFLNVDYLRQPLAIGLVLAALGLWVSALGLFIGVTARDDSQVVLFSLISMFVFSALGGVWFPMETVGEGFAMVGKLTPGYYAMVGLQNILVREQGLPSVVMPVLVLTGFGLLFFIGALWRFSKTQLK